MKKPRVFREAVVFQADNQKVFLCERINGKDRFQTIWLSQFWKTPIVSVQDKCQKLNEWTQQSYVKNGFSPKWLGNIVMGCLIDIGACTVETAEQEYQRREAQNALEKRRWPRPCGILVGAVRIEEGDLCFETETALEYIADVFEWVIQKLGLSVKCWYIAEELCDGLYYTNDTDSAVFDHSFDFYVDGPIEAVDSAGGKSKYIEGSYMDREKFLRFCESILGRELDRQMSDDALDAVIAEIEKYNYIKIYRLQRG